MVNIKVSRICNNDCIFTCHKAACKRGMWAKPLFATATLPKVGIDDECPLMQFSARQSDKYKNYNITEHGTWRLCAECKYSETTENGNISIERSFEAHCLDCPVHHIRESLRENRAEADRS